MPFIDLRVAVGGSALDGIIFEYRTFVFNPFFAIPETTLPPPSFFH